MRGLLFIVMLIFTLSTQVNPANADEIKKTPESTVAERSHVDTSDVERFWSDLVQQYSGYLPSDTPSITDTIRKDGLSLQNVLSGLGKFFFSELYTNFKLLGTILLLTVFAAILSNMQSAFERTTVSTVAFAVTHMVLLVLAVNSLYQAMGYARQAIQTMSDFMMAAIPLVMTLLASTGGLTSVAMLHPTIVLTVTTVGTVVNHVVFPLIFVSAILHLASTLSERYKVTQLANLLRTFAVGIMGVMFSVFIGVMAVKGALGGVADGVAIRTLKYASSNFIPVVGKLFSDAADTVVGTSLIVKNTAGVAGLVILLMICVFPAIKIISLAIIYNMCSAIMQPLGSSPIISCLSMIGKTLIAVFAALATVAFMFFVSITVIIAAGNVALMVR